MRQLRAGLASRRTLTCAVIACWLAAAACLAAMATRGASMALMIAWLAAIASSVVVAWRAGLPPPRPPGGAWTGPSRLDGDSRQLLLRAQAAVRAVLGAPPAAAGGSQPAAVLRHEQEIAATLGEISALRAELDVIPPAARGPVTEAVIAAQQRALDLAAEAATARVAALERLAAQVQAAEAARLDWASAHRAAARNDRFLDLLARTAADGHATAEISGLAEQAARAARVLRDSLAAPAAEPEILAIPARAEPPPAGAAE